MKKRILAMALTLAMLLSMLPAQVFATGPVINGGIHTEHHFEPVTDLPEVQAPTEVIDSQVQDPGEDSAQLEPTAPVVTESDDNKPPKRGTDAHAAHSITAGANVSGETIDFGIELNSDNISDYFYDDGSVKMVKLSEGSYYLTSNITVSEDYPIYFSGHVDICLNGYDLEIMEYFYPWYPMDGGTYEPPTIRICDCWTEAVGDSRGPGVLSGAADMIVNQGWTGNLGVFYFDGYCFGTLEFYGGALRSNSGKSDLPTLSATGSSSYVSLYGGEISNSSGTAVYIDGSSFIMGGSPVVEGKTSDITLANGSLIDLQTNIPLIHPTGDAYGVQITGDTAGEPIQITRGYETSGTEGIPFASVDSQYECFVMTCPDTGKNEIYIGTTTHESHTHTMSVDCSVSDNKEENIVFATELNQDNIGSYKSDYALADGYYVLTSDITIDMIYLNSYAYICLNGYTITSTHNNANFQTHSDRTLHICDCSNDKSGTLNSNNSRLFMWNFGGTMNIYGGNYLGNKDYGLYVRSAVNFYGGYVYGKNYGACLESGTLTIAGGTITSDDMGIEFYGGTLKLSGSPVINGTSEDIYLYNGKLITVTDLLTPPEGETYSIRLDGTKPSVGNPVQITQGFAENGNTYNCFTSADPNYFTYVKNGEVYLGVKANITVQTEGEGTAVAKDANGNVISLALETETVKIDATPAEGYTVAKVVLSYMEGETEVRKLVFIDDDGMYGFPMPGVEATVTVTFREKHIHTLADGSTIVYDTFVDQEVWDSIRGSVPEGNYVLVDHVSGHCSLKSNSYINICLCGYDVNATGSETQLYTGTTLRIDDCTPDDELLGTISMPQVYAKGPGHIIIADGIYHGYGSIASIALKGGSFTMEGGYFISDASSGIALGSQTAGISDFYILGGSLKCTTGMVLEGDCGKIVLGGDTAITGKDYDIRFYPGYLISFDKDYPLNPPTGETYILYLASGSVTAEQPVQLTSGWADSGLASTATTEAKIPFVSTQGYAVREIADANGVRELYLVIPEVTVVYDDTMGEASATPTGGNKDTGITVNAAPKAGYAIESITMSYWNGTQTVTSTLLPSGMERNPVEKTFTMPAADVTVHVNFIEPHAHYMAVDTKNGGKQADGQEGVEVRFETSIDSVEGFKELLDNEVIQADNLTGCIPAGSYVLTNDIDYSGRHDCFTIRGEVNLCLNGHTFDIHESRIEIHDGGTLNICDCSKDKGSTDIGTLRGCSWQNAPMIKVINGNVNFYGGKLDCYGSDQPAISTVKNSENTKNTIKVFAGEIVSVVTTISNANGIVDIYNGVVKSERNFAIGMGAGGSDNVVTVHDGLVWSVYNHTAIGSGGMNSGSLYVLGGTVLAEGNANNHEEYSECFGAISLYFGTKLYLYGGKVEATGDNNSGVYSEGQIFMHGDPVVEGTFSDFFLYWDCVINIDGVVGGTDTFSVFTKEKPEDYNGGKVPVTTDWVESEIPMSRFLSVEGYDIRTRIAEDSRLEVHLVLLHKHYMAVDTDKGLPNPTTEDPENNDADYVTFDIEITSAAELDGYMDEEGRLKPGSYVLMESFTYDKPITLGGNVNLCLNGNTLTLKAPITVSESADSNHTTYTLNICDCSEKTEENPFGTGKMVKEGSFDSHGLVIAWNGNINIYGGTLEAEKTTSDGEDFQGVVSAIDESESGADTATVSVYGGRIRAKDCSAIHTEGARGKCIEIHGGYLSSNGLDTIDCHAGSSIWMTGGKVENTGSGDGIYYHGASLLVEGGEISVQSGDGIYVQAEAGGTIAGGTIHSVSGNGIMNEYCDYGLYIRGGTISSDTGNGIYNYESLAYLYVYGGDIFSGYMDNGVYTGSGHGIYNYWNYSCSIYGGNIWACEGAGVYNECGTVEIATDESCEPPVIRSEKGDGVYNEYGTVTISTEEGCEPPVIRSEKGDGVYNNGGDVTISADESCEPPVIRSEKGTGVVNDNYGSLDVSAGNITGAIYGIAHRGYVFYLSNNPVISGPDGDIYLAMDQVITVKGPLGPKEGSEETANIYYVLTEEILNGDTNPIRITEDWGDTHHTYEQSKGLDNHPFRSAAGYDVFVLPADAVAEVEHTNQDVYFALPKLAQPLTLYLWEGHETLVSKEKLMQTLLDCDSKGFFSEGGIFVLEEMDFGGNWDTVGFQGVPVNDGGYKLSATTAGAQRATVTATYSVEGSRSTVYVDVLVQVYQVANSVFVLDYGNKAELTCSDKFYADDKLPGTVQGGAQGNDINTVMTSVAMSTDTIVYNPVEESFSQDICLRESDGTGTWGVFSITKDGKLIYTPNAMKGEADTMYVVLRAGKLGTEYTGKVDSILRIDPTVEALMTKEVKILPANVVYYEDYFQGLEWYKDQSENSIIKIEDLGENYADGYQDLDQDQPYGNDSSYTDLTEGYVGSGGNSKKITVTGKGEVLRFDFKGTGFDLIGSTTADSGSLIYAVYQVDPGAEETKDDLVIRSTLNTAYKVSGGAIYEVPLVHVTDLPHNNYRVIVTSVPKYDWSSPTDSNGIPTKMVPVYLYLDGVRIYNPIAMGADDRQHYNDGEKTAQFIQLRNMILEGQAAAAKITDDGRFTFGSGLVSYVQSSPNEKWYTGNNVSSLNQYLTAGPNNEVYFNENTQTLVLYAREIQPGENGALNTATMLQIAIRNLNPEANYDKDETAKAPAFALLGVGGSEAQLLCQETSPISYTEQYYTINLTDCATEEIGGNTYYRVVISARNSSAFSLTNLKVSNLEFYTIPASASTYKYNSNGELIETNNPNATEMPNLQQLAWQLMAANGMLPEDPMTPEDSTKELVFRAISLSLHSSIGMNFYVTDEALKGYTDPYVVVTKELYDATGNVKEESFTATLEDFERTTAAGEACHVFHFSNIAAKEMNSKITLTLWATKDGEKVEGETRTYSVVQYAQNMLEKTQDVKLKTLLADMLNYGAAAQIYFNYNNSEETRANNVSEEIRNAVEAYATTAAPEVKSYITSSTTNGDQLIQMEVGISNVSLSLVDRVEANFYMQDMGESQDLSKVTLVVAYEDITGNVVQQQIKGTDFTQVKDTTGRTLYKAIFNKLNATEMRSIMNVWVVDESGMRISNAITYSVESYAATMKDKEGASATLQSLLEAMMKYGDAAEAYFHTLAASASAS